MTEATNVGTIVAKLKIDASEWMHELASAEARAHSLGRANPKIRVETAGTKQAVAELAAVEVAEKKVSASSAALARMRTQGRAIAIAQALADKESIKPKMDFTEWTKRSTEATKQDTAAKEKTSESNRKVDSTAKQAGGSIHLLYSALAMLAPAAVPIAGVAAAGAAALGALGVAGVLAIVGVNEEMKKGGPVGNQYAAGVEQIKDQFKGLAATSAEGTLEGFNRSANTLNAYMPSLNRQMGDFSRVTGNVAANGLTGMLGMFTTLDPVMRGFAGYLGELSSRFATIGQSNGLRSFGDYALAVMPEVMATIESLVRGVGNLISALAPLGSVALTSLKVIGDILDGIPTEVLTLLVSGALGAYAAFATWSALIPIIQSFGLMLNLSLGPIGLVVAGVGALIGVMVGSAASTKDATAATMGYTAALQRDNGIIAENVRAHTAEQIAKSQAADAAKKLGINLETLTQAALGNKDAQGELTRTLDALEAKSKDVNSINLEMGGTNVDQMKINAQVQASVKSVREEIGNQNSALNQAVEYEKRFNEAKGQTGTTLDAQAGKLTMMAGMLGTNVAALAGAEEAERKTADQLAATTLQMQFQNDAGGLLKMQLDLLAGKSLSFEQAQNSFERQLISTTQTIKSNGTALEGNSEAAVTNRGNLLQLVSSAQLSAEAFGTMTGSSEQARQKLIAQRQAIIDNAVANGQNRDAVTRYIDSIMKIPASVPPTKITVDTAFAEQQLAALTRNREVRINAIVTRSELPDLNGAASGSGRMGTYAKGGMVNYLASGGFPQFKPIGTDTVPAMLTPGEIVIKKSSVDSIGADKLLHANETGRLPEGGNTFNIYDTSGNPVSTAYTTARVLAARSV
ncbi:MULTISPECIES: hypothetical protein [Paenarthrobacter]|uniref:hypothetical protein n=1 Tax=Paenarthrobacter TaxID=1742992 RepID=UPI00084E5CD3|nr:hypothetical protein [Paenarthrobacter ureafaciens]NKR11232.1 hypothetical protein [Arthrobacter sp. M5]NKR18037.1 hypothetical protein [Arthrobacter sp. M6]OEH58374.1 hypothetical protein A5N17_01740 [Arthrobacter sp. D2]OEH62036.1 hypothetical protein A5N13_15225 [Arthrobacter sp. D4]QMU82121.1 hypothetical protein FV140_08235 [Paenarthrobacter ureafaciens]